MPDLSVWPTDGADGSVSSEARWRKMARLWVPSGVRREADLVPTLAAGPTVNISAGQAFIDGHLAELTAPASLPATADGLVVIRFTPADNRAELMYRAGVALTLTQTDATWELPIALVSAGGLYDRRAILGNATATSAIGTGSITITSVSPAAQAVPNAQIVLWGTGTYLVTCSFEMNVAAVSGTTYAFGTLNVTGCTFLTPAIPPRCALLMATVGDLTMSFATLVRVDAPASAVLNLVGSKSAAAGVFNITSTANGTWISAVRVA